jgi:PIN domain nuclease of toxin-antitoxin system
VAAGVMAWDHRDPFDRLLAATAQRLGCPIISADAAFDGVVQRVW